MSGWEPDQYHRFQTERQAPFFDLVSLMRAVPDGRVIDLGCGTGELTVELHRRLEAVEAVGVDEARPRCWRRRRRSRSVTFREEATSGRSRTQALRMRSWPTSLHWSS